MKYLIDSDWIINYLRSRSPYVEILEELKAAGISVSSVVVAEVLTRIVGEQNETEKMKALEKFLEPVTPLFFDHSLALTFAKIRKYLLRKHTPLENFDIAIAATAVENNLTLLTDNRSHFRKVPGLKVYSSS